MFDISFVRAGTELSNVRVWCDRPDWIQVMSYTLTKWSAPVF